MIVLKMIETCCDISELSLASSLNFLNLKVSAAVKMKLDFVPSCC